MLLHKIFSRVFTINIYLWPMVKNQGRGENRYFDAKNRFLVLTNRQTPIGLLQGPVRGAFRVYSLLKVSRLPINSCNVPFRLRGEVLHPQEAPPGFEGHWVEMPFPAPTGVICLL